MYWYLYWVWLNICQLLVMWFLSNRVLCSHHMTTNILVHICNTHNICRIQLCICSGLQQVDGLVPLPSLCFLRCNLNLLLEDAVCVIDGSAVSSTNCRLQWWRRAAWLHTTCTRAHFLRQQLQMKCTQRVTALSIIGAFYNFLLTGPFWWEDRCLLEEQTIFHLHDRCHLSNTKHLRRVYHK